MNPVDFFNDWYKQADSAQQVEPFAFVLGTAIDGQPRSRVVLWRRLVDGIFYFFTNYTSDKAQEIEKNPKVSMNFHWRAPKHRQVRIQGTIVKASKEISDEYFSTRPRGSQIGAWSSPQSQQITNRAELEQRVRDMEAQFEGREVPRPEFWGGYGIVPEYFEFWEEGESRLHTRFVFMRTETGWSEKTIAP